MAFRPEFKLFASSVDFRGGSLRPFGILSAVLEVMESLL